MFDIQKKLAARSEEILHDEFGISSKVTFDIPRDTHHGDLTSSIALEVSRSVQKKPQEVAEKIISGISSLEGISHASIAGAGYINVTLTSSALLTGLSFVQDTCVPKKASKKEAPVIVDYSGPNIAKPLGIHHILSTVIGQSIVNLHRHRGYQTVAINHIGDWGTQFGKLAVAHQKWGMKEIQKHSLDDLLALYVRFHEEMEKDTALDDEARDAFRKLEEGDAALRSFWKDVVSITMKDIEKLYERLHVSFDHTHGESFYEDKMQAIIDEGKKKKVFVPGEEGTIIVEFPEEQNMPPGIIVKGDGSTIYLTRDLATIQYRLKTWHPQAILYVVDVAQQLHFKQLFKTAHRLGWDLPSLEHIVFGRMSFADKSMSTRKGNILKLEDVLDEAVRRADQLIAEKSSDIQGKERGELSEMMGIGSVVYGILSQNRKMNIVFDWAKVLSFEGNSAPYLQYTHARACSVLRKAGLKKSLQLQDTDDLPVSRSERDLVLLLLRFDAVLASALRDRMPHTLSQYLYELAQGFNAFYHNSPILDSEEPLRAFRLFLTSLTALVLKTGASILTLRVPERM